MGLDFPEVSHNRIDKKKFNDGWDRIFGKDSNKEIEVDRSYFNQIVDPAIDRAFEIISKHFTCTIRLEKKNGKLGVKVV